MKTRFDDHTPGDPCVCRLRAAVETPYHVFIGPCLHDTIADLLRVACEMAPLIERWLKFQEIPGPSQKGLVELEKECHQALAAFHALVDVDPKPGEG